MHKIINPSYHQLNIFMEDFFSATMKKKTFSLSANNSFLFFQNVGEDRTLANWFKWSTFYAVSFSHFILWLKNYPECISIIFNAIRIHYARGKGGGYNFRFFFAMKKESCFNISKASDVPVLFNLLEVKMNQNSEKIDCYQQRITSKNTFEMFSCWFLEWGYCFSKT